MIPMTVDHAMTHDRAERGWGCLDTARGRLPLAAVDVDVRIAGLEATTEVRQTFVNHLREPIEATYVFPLPDRAAVHRFRMQVGGRVVEGVLDERGAARASYEQAIASGRRAAIAEEDRAGVFTLRVGNLMPGEIAIVELALQGPLPIDDGEVTWMFPLVVAPRYIPGAPLPGDQAGLGTALDTDQVPDASRISPPVLLPGMPNPVRLGVRLAIDGGGLPIGGLRANLAELEGRFDGATWMIGLRPGQRLDRDLILRWQLGAATLCSSAVWAPDADGQGATVAVTVVPPVASAAAGRPRDVVILLDRSGSMEGWKMVAARRAAARVVDSLTARDGFAVIAFDDRLESPRGLGPVSSTPATDRNRFRAVEFLAGLESRGGTELAAPLEAALSSLAPRRERDQVIVLITDGQVGNEDQILQQLGRRLGGIRMFTLGVDQAVNAAFLRRLAALGGGACELVESEDRLDEVMGKIHRRIATPILTDLTLRGPGLDPASQAPRRLPAVFAGAPVTVYVRWPGRPVPGQTIELVGRLPAGTATTSAIAIDSARPGVNLEAAWARAHIRDLEDRYAAGETHGALERQIVATSLRHRVLSRFTAFVAIDREVVTHGQAPRAIIQPVEAPAGWGAASPRPPGMPMPMSNAVPAMPSAMPSAPAGRRMAVGGAAGGPPGMPGFGGPPGMPGMGPPPMPGAASGGGGYRAKESEADEDLAMADFEEAADRRESGRASKIAAPAPMARHQPPAPPPSASMSAPRVKRAVEMPREEGPVDPQPYLQRLADLIDQLEAAARAADPWQAAQLPVARIGELFDDVRSVGLHELAIEIGIPFQDVRDALAAPDLVERLLEAVAALREVLQKAPPPRPAGRSAFWK